MDDMQAFERQVADVASRVAGPPRHVDALAVARAAATGPSTPWYARWRSHGVYVSAAAAVALMALLFVSALLVVQQDVTDEVGVSPSPSPSTLPTSAPPDIVDGGTQTVTESQVYDGLRAAIVQLFPDVAERGRFEIDNLHISSATASEVIQREIEDAAEHPGEDWDVEGTIAGWDAIASSTGLTLDDTLVVAFELEHPELAHPVVDAAISGIAVSFPGIDPESVPLSTERTADEQAAVVSIGGKTLLRWPVDPEAGPDFSWYSYRYGDTVIDFTAHRSLEEAFIEVLPPTTEEAPD